MKNQVKMILFASVLFFNTTALAVSEYHTPDYEKRMCFAEGIMEEVIKEAAKETLNSVGKHLIKKYIKEDGQNPNKNNDNDDAANQEDSDAKES